MRSMYPLKLELRLSLLLEAAWPDSDAPNRTKNEIRYIKPMTTNCGPAPNLDINIPEIKAPKTPPV